MTICYTVGDSLYLNLTNRCSCACTFCIRRDADHVGDASNLWLEREPTADEVVADLATRPLDSYREIVFCGYGEPTEALDVMLEVCRYLKARVPGTPTRVNTNGLSDLTHGQPTAARLEGLMDIVSVSLNAADAASYNEVCRPRFGEAAFDAMLAFAASCKSYVPDVRFTVVDVIGERAVQRCQEIADSLGIPLRVRREIRNSTKPKRESAATPRVALQHG